MNDNPTYEQAIEELELLLAVIENSEISVDSLAEKVRRAAFLINECKKALHVTEEEVKKILEEMDKGQNPELQKTP
ncbi:MAG TPA: exodeoxyribonuclease VII small subunit [Bacteroidales bacterium]|nr:exodeoxyribonuclease VII small subunit [Bacteroidales bacterium]